MKGWQFATLILLLGGGGAAAYFLLLKPKASARPPAMPATTTAIQRGAGTPASTSGSNEWDAVAGIATGVGQIVSSFIQTEAFEGLFADEEEVGYGGSEFAASLARTQVSSDIPDYGI